jgi:NitT/TauT family transport system substrate-binding protein
MRTNLIVCLLLAGCANQPATIPVRIANVGTGLQTWCMPVTLASTLGYYKAEGLDVTLENLSSGTKTLQALIGGSVDVADFFYEHNVQIAAEGQHLRSFFVMARLDSRVLIVAPSAKARIYRPEDLRGGLIGVPSPGSAGHLFVKYYLAVHGMQPSDYRVVGIGNGAAAFAAIESGRIDAGEVSGGDHIRFLRRNPGTRFLMDTSTPEGMRESFGADTFPTGVLAARQDWLDRNPDTARRLARALQRTLQWIATHTPEEIRERLPDSFRSQDAAVDLEIIRWSLPAFTSDGAMPASGPNTVKRFLDATIDKVRDSKFDLAATWTNGFLPEAK